MIVIVNQEDYYDYKISLSEILKDLKSEYYLQGSQEVKITKINDLIEEYEQINPFDRLEEDQKYEFINVKEKLGEQFSLVVEDIARIAQKMFERNALVNEYLKDAKSSFWISVVAIVLSVFGLVFSYLISRKKVLKKVLLEALSEIRSSETPEENEEGNENLKDDEEQEVSNTTNS